MPAAVHIAQVLQRLDFFQFFNFFYNLHDLQQKKKLHDLPQKLKNPIFFYNSHDLQQKKKITRIYSKKKNYTTIRFFCTRLTFFTTSGMKSWVRTQMPENHFWTRDINNNTPPPPFYPALERPRRTIARTHLYQSNEAASKEKEKRRKSLRRTPQRNKHAPYPRANSYRLYRASGTEQASPNKVSKDLPDLPPSCFEK